MKHYKFKKDGVQHGHGTMKGQIVQLDDEQAKPLLKQDVVVEVEKETASDLPEDLPGRDHLTDFSLDDIKEMDSEMLQDVKGIGQATAQSIIKYLNENED